MIDLIFYFTKSDNRKQSSKRGGGGQLPAPGHGSFTSIGVQRGGGDGPSPPLFWDILLRISQKDLIFINIHPFVSPFEFLCMPLTSSFLVFVK